MDLSRNGIRRGFSLPRFVSSLIVGASLLSNVVGVYASEGNFWKERNDAARRRAIPTLLAQLPGNMRSLTVGHEVIPALTPDDPGNAVSSALRSLPPKAAKQMGWMPALVRPFGEIREIHLSSNPHAPFIVHLQDVHEVEEAQKNLAGLVEAFHTKRGISLVGLEGAVGPFDLDRYRSNSSPEITRGLANAFLKLGCLTGPEVAGIVATKVPTLWGVEDLSLYRGHVEAFQEAEKIRTEVRSSLARLVRAADEARIKIYPPLLRSMDDHRLAYQAHHESMGEYIPTLWDSLKGSRESFPNVARFVKALEWERALDFKEVERERSVLVDVLAHRLSALSLEHLVQESLAYRAGRLALGDYQRYLLALCQENGVRLDAYGSLNSYISYVLLAERIEPGPLLEEIDGLESAVFSALTKTKEQRQLVAVQRGLTLLDKLTLHALTPTEWEAYKKEKMFVRNIPRTLSSLLGHPIPSIDGLLSSPDSSSFEMFCERALDRNAALVQNLLAKMRAKKSNSAVLVAGGFHTEGMAHLLRKEDVSYVVVSPKISTLSETTRPLDIFVRAPVPLEKLLAGDVIHLAYARLTQMNSDAIGVVPDGPVRQKTLRSGWGRLVVALGKVLSKNPLSQGTLPRGEEGNGDSSDLICVERNADSQKGVEIKVGDKTYVTQLLKKDPVKETLIQWIGSVILPALMLILAPELTADIPLVSFISFFPTQSFLMSLPGHQTADPKKRQTIRRNLTLIYGLMSVVFLALNAWGMTTWIRIVLSGLLAFFLGLSLHRENNFNVIKAISIPPSLRTRLIQRWIPFLNFGAVLLSGSRPKLSATRAAQFPVGSFSNLDSSEDDLTRDVRALALNEFLKSGQPKVVQMYLQLLQAARDLPETWNTLLPAVEKFGIKLDPRGGEFLLAYEAARVPHFETIALRIASIAAEPRGAVGLAALFILASDGIERTEEELQVVAARSKWEDYKPETLTLALNKLRTSALVSSEDGVHWAIDPNARNYIQHAFPDTLELLTRPNERILEEDLMNRIRRLVWNARLHKRFLLQPGGPKSFLRIEAKVDAEKAKRILGSLAFSMTFLQADKDVPLTPFGLNEENSVPLFDVVIEMDPQKPFLEQWVHPSFFRPSPIKARMIRHDAKNDAICVDMDRSEFIYGWVKERTLPPVHLDDEGRRTYLSSFIESLSNESDSTKADIQILFGLLLNKQIDIVNVGSALRTMGYSMGGAARIIASFLSFNRPVEVTDMRDKIQFYNPDFDPTKKEGLTNIKDQVRYFLEKQEFLSDRGKSFAGQLEVALSSQNASEALGRLRSSFPSLAEPHLDYFTPLQEPQMGWAHFFSKFSTLQITEGCSKGCLHCSAAPSMAVHSMPFYRILQFFIVAEGMNLQGSDVRLKIAKTLYENGESLEYFDPMLNADLGDVLAAFAAHLPHEKINMTTRGWDIGDKIGERAMAKIAKLMWQYPHLLNVRISLDLFSIRWDLYRSLARQLGIVSRFVDASPSPIELVSVTTYEWQNMQGNVVSNVLSLFLGRTSIQDGLTAISISGRAQKNGFTSAKEHSGYDPAACSFGYHVRTNGVLYEKNAVATVSLTPHTVALWREEEVFDRSLVQPQPSPEVNDQGSLWPKAEVWDLSSIQPRQSLPTSTHPLEITGAGGGFFKLDAKEEEILKLGKRPLSARRKRTSSLGLLPLVGRPIYLGLRKIGFSPRMSAATSGFVEQGILLSPLYLLAWGIDSLSGIGFLNSLLLSTLLAFIPFLKYFPASHGEKVLVYRKNAITSSSGLEEVWLDESLLTQLRIAAWLFFGSFLFVLALPYLATFLVGTSFIGSLDFYVWGAAMVSSLVHGIYDFNPPEGFPVALGRVEHQHHSTNENRIFLESSLLGGPSGGKLERVKGVVDPKTIRERVAKDRASLDAQRQAMAVSLGLASDADVTKIAESAAQRHRSLPQIIENGVSIFQTEIDAILAFAFAEGGVRKVIETVQSYHLAQGMLDFKESLAASIRQGGEIVLEVTTEMVSGKKGGLSLAAQAQWDRLKILANAANGGTLKKPVCLVLQEGIEQKEVERALVLRECGSLMGLNSKTISKADLAVSAGKYSVDKFLVWLEREQGPRADPGPVDIHLMNRDEWDFVGSFRYNIRLLVDVLPGIAFDATRRLTNGIQRLLVVDITA